VTIEEEPAADDSLQSSMIRSSDAQSRHRLLELAALFTRLGFTAFGGPAVHTAMMEDEVVTRRAWLDRQHFLDLVASVNFVPGPNSTELAIHIGLARGGWPGLFVAGASFILPAAFIVTAIAWVYVTYGALPAIAGVLAGVKPVVIAVVAQALVYLARSAVKSAWLAAVAVLAIAAVAMGVHELIVLAAAGVVCAAPAVLTRKGGAAVLFLLGTATKASAAAGAAAAPFTLPALFVLFVKIGSVLFGSGYVLLAFLRADFVERLGWLTESQLLDAVAVGQITQGPVFTTATFIGYLLGGGPGAAVATLAIFLPAFVFVALSGPLVPRLRRSRVAAAVLDGVNVASLALMVVVTWQLAAATLVGLVPIAIAAASFVALARYEVSATWLLLAAAAVGWLMS
jgi:chromate transporter